MSLNLDIIKSRLAALENKGKKSTNNKSKDVIWKPQAGKQIVRIVPYQHQPGDPFVQLKFHYDFGGKTYLSPSSFNKPDPIVELSDRLKKNTDSWQQGRKLEPKLRTYVPIIVRGEEEKGVRFWAFGVQIYKQIMTAMTEPDYGDITDLNNGYDIGVEYKSAQDAKKDFPETTIFIKPKPRPVIDPLSPKAKEIMDLITTKQPNILEVYDLPTYDELQTALEQYLNSSKDETPENDSKPSTVPVVSVEPKTEVNVSPTANKASSTDSMEEAFDKLFNT